MNNTLRWGRTLSGLWKPGDVLYKNDERRLIRVSDMEVEDAIALWEKMHSIRCSGHRVPGDEEYADWLEDDPTGNTGNTTVGAGLLTNTRDVYLTLRSSASSGTERRTLNDPPKTGLMLGLILFKKTAVNLTVLCQTPIWLGSTVTQPALTNLGQLITFSTLNHSIYLQSVPVVVNTSFSGTQSTFANTTGSRWMTVQSDGPTVT